MKTNKLLMAFLGALSCLSLPTHADEFTVGHTGADLAFSQQGLTGNGITVAVLDSGVQTTRYDLNVAGSSTSRILTRVNFTNETSVYDYCGHGTHIGGIIAGNGASSTGSQYTRTFQGIARKANLVSVKVLDTYGQGTVSQVISGIQWCITNKAKYNIRVINLSLGHPVGESYTTDPLCQAVEAAYRAGIVVVCAAGNNGRSNATQTAGMDNEGWGTAYGSINSPGNDPYVITVGAVKQTDGNRVHDTIATYSGRGPSRLDFVMKPDIVAPGNRVISVTCTDGYLLSAYGGSNAVPLSAYSTSGTGNSLYYFQLSGTSMAAPVVAGAAALLLQKYPTLTPDSVKARLMISADKWMTPSGGWDNMAYGAGYLNIPAALASTAVATKPATSPSLYQDALGVVQVNTNQILWGTQVIWGVSGVNNLQVIWGNQVIWGTQVLWGNQVIWGSSIWADQVIWGTGSSTVDLTSKAIYGEN
jgi:serine protease AprX